MSTIARREFLKKGASALIVGVSAHGAGWRFLAAVEDAAGDGGARPAARSVLADQLDSWLAIGTDGKVTVYTGRVDMGTGVRTSFAQVIADELDVTFQNVDIVMGDTDLTPDQGKTTASNDQHGLALLSHSHVCGHSANRDDPDRSAWRGFVRGRRSGIGAHGSGHRQRHFRCDGHAPARDSFLT